MQVLSIGNSFSQDAQRWLHDIAVRDGVELETVNLPIGGCPLVTHWANFQSGAEAYDYEHNAQLLRRASLPDTLQEQAWDVVTVQQASHDSGNYSTYQPYLSQLAEGIRRLCPTAQIYIHQTWSYEVDSDHGGFVAYHRNQREMYDRVTEAYTWAAEAIQAPILPVGEVIQNLREHTREFD